MELREFHKSKAGNNVEEVCNIGNEVLITHSKLLLEWVLSCLYGMVLRELLIRTLCYKWKDTRN